MLVRAHNFRVIENYSAGVCSEVKRDVVNLAYSSDGDGAAFGGNVSLARASELVSRQVKLLRVDAYVLYESR